MEEQNFNIDTIFGLIFIILIGYNIYLAKKLDKSVGWTLLGSFCFCVFPVSIYLYYKMKKEKKDQIDWTEKRNKEQIETEEKRKKEENSPQYKREKLLEKLNDISGVSDKVARTLIDQYPTQESIANASEEQLIDIPGIGSSVAKAIKARIR